MTNKFKPQVPDVAAAPVLLDRGRQSKALTPTADQDPSRRKLLLGAAAAGAAAVAAAPKQAQAIAPPGAVEYPVPVDPTQVPGRPPGLNGGYGTRSQFESEVREWSSSGTSSRTPLASSEGTITPSALHFERHHNGIPEIDPEEHSLLVHGMVKRPLTFTIADLKRLPSTSRVAFIECGGNSAGEYHAARGHEIHNMHGLVSSSEWTGVALSTVLREAGLESGAAWLLAEGRDAAMVSRSIPLEKALDDAVLAYAQNGEALRPEQGYPLRLLLPGWEGITNVKWLHRLDVSDAPFQTREETSHYTDLNIVTGEAKQFTFVMAAKSLILFPHPEAKLEGPGFFEITGLAWSGRGKIKRVEVTTDGGKNWHLAELQDPVLSKSQTRFRFPWVWDGEPTMLQSRATDETGYVQPSIRQLKEVRGDAERGNVNYHNNAIQTWRVNRGGTIENVHFSRNS
jgi:sulfane dehydrogenase subunit SoxC